MRQEVNLYLPEFFPKKLWLSFSQALFLSFIFLILLSVFFFYQNTRYTALKQENKRLGEASSISSQQLIADVKRKSERQRRKISLESDIKSLENKNSSKKQFKSYYESVGGNDFISFHNMFYEIARKSSRNTSISKIEITQGGDKVFLSGLSLNKTAIPLYLSALKSSEPFSRSEFGLLKIAMVEGKTFYRFEMKVDGDG